MANLIKQKFLEGIDSTKFKVAQNGAIIALDSSGNEVEILKLDANNNALVLGVEKADKSALEQEVSDRQAAVSAEAADRVAGDAALQTQIDSIISNVDPAALDSLSEIVAAFQAADSDLDGAITALGTSASSALGEETAARIAADEALQDAIDAEEARAMGAESALDMRLTTAEGEIDTLQSDMDAAELAISNEVSRAQSAESALDMRLTTAEGEIDTLQSDMDAAELAISNEVSARIAADADLQSQIDDVDGYAQEVRSDLEQEILDRGAGDTNLQNQINNILSNTDPAALDSLTEIVAAFEAADDDLNGAITALGTSSSSALGVETAARIAADEALQDAIDAEVAAREAAVSAEEAARIADVDAEEARAIAAEGVLQSNIDAEVSAREAAVSAEEARAVAAEGVLQSNIDAEVSAREAAVSAEEAARIAEDLTFLKLDGSREMVGDLYFASGSDVYEPGMQGNPVSYNIYDDSGALGYYGMYGNDTFYSFASNQPYFSISNATASTITFTLTQEATIWFGVYTDVGNSDSEAVTYPAGTYTIVLNDLNYLVSYGYSYRVKNIENPSDPKDAANKQWVDGRISSEKTFQKDSFTIDSESEFSSVTLNYEAKANSCVVFVNRLALHEGADYSVAVVDGVSVITWLGDFAVGGAEAIEEGDVINVTYMY
jgi:hypothetical protein